MCRRSPVASRPAGPHRAHRSGPKLPPEPRSSALSRTTFRDLGVPADLAAVLERQNITEPFAIQAATLPDGIAGHDICGRAPTGSGKTLAFGLALVARAPKAKPVWPTALVLVPTRELAAQVETVLRPLAKARGKYVATV